MIYNSDPYNLISKKFTDFKDLKLLDETKQNPMPKHIAIIMDGNRRFAKDLGLKPEARASNWKRKNSRCIRLVF